MSCAHAGARGMLALCGVLLCQAWLSVAAAQSLRSAAGAHNQPTAADIEARRTTMARALFEEGLRFVDAGQWGDARDRFARVLEMRYSTVAAYNLGLAQARMGQGVIAAATLRKLLADPALEPKVRDPATALLAEVERQFGWLTLRVVGACDGCSVQVDREEWPPAVLGVAVPIDPGAHVLQLQWGNTLLASDRVEVAAATRIEAALAARPGAIQAARGARFGTPNSDDHSEPLRPRTAGSRGHTSLLGSPWFWSAMGVLIAGAAITLVIETR